MVEHERWQRSNRYHGLANSVFSHEGAHGNNAPGGILDDPGKDQRKAESSPLPGFESSSQFRPGRRQEQSLLGQGKRTAERRRQLSSNREKGWRAASANPFYVQHAWQHQTNTSSGNPNRVKPQVACYPKNFGLGVSGPRE